MKLEELLVDAWVAVPMEAADLGQALREMLMRVYRQGVVDETRALKLARDLAFGSQGEVVRINDRVVAVLGSLEALDGPSVAVGVAREAFGVTAEGAGEPGTARAVVLFLTPGSLTGVRQQILPVVTRALRDPTRTDRLLAVGSVSEIRGIRELMEAEFQTRHLVEDALLPLRYRVYPDTPLAEVLDLMVRREVHAVPVVGPQYEVLGILTSGDALRHLIRRGRPEAEDAAPAAREAPLARDVMTRTVLCVSEDQSMVEAANMMVNRDVEQLPVVREGELVGFITRESILRALYGRPAKSNTEEEGDGTP